MERMMKSKKTAGDIEALEQHCFRELRLSDLDAALLRLSVRKDNSPEELSSFYGKVVFDELQGQQSCALASLSQRMGYQGVPDALLPRVKGVFRYHSARNAAQMKELFCILQKMNEAGASVMFLGNAAMKAYYLPHAVRYTGSFCIRVKSDGAENAVMALKKSGEYTVRDGMLQSVVIPNRQKPGMQVSCLIDQDFETNHEGGIFREGAAETVFQCERVFIPSRETQLFHILSAVFQAVLSGENHRFGRIQWAQDSVCLLGEDGFAWKRLGEICSRLDRTADILIMLKILNRLFPALVPEEAFSSLQLSAAEKKRVPVLFRLIRVKEKLSSFEQGGTGRRRCLRYYFFRLRLYWYKNRCLGKWSGLAADLCSFPSYLKASLGVRTWKDFARFISTKKQRETI